MLWRHSGTVCDMTTSQCSLDWNTDTGSSNRMEILLSPLTLLFLSFQLWLIRLVKAFYLGLIDSKLLLNSILRHFPVEVKVTASSPVLFFEKMISDFIWRVALLTNSALALSDQTGRSAASNGAAFIFWLNGGLDCAASLQTTWNIDRTTEHALFWSFYICMHRNMHEDINDSDCRGISHKPRE